MKILFLDESGDHDLIKVDPLYPVFVLAGCIIDSAYQDSVLAPGLAKIKKDMFKTDAIVLHFCDYTRNQNGFEKMSDKAFI